LRHNSIESIPYSTLHVPLNVIIAEGETVKIPYNVTKIQAFVDYSNEVWSAAGIVFEINSVKFITVPDWRARPLQSNADLCQFGKDFLGSDFEDGVIDMVYIKDFLLSFDDSGGGLTLHNGAIDAAFIEEFADDYRGNHTLAHELGHALNLVHVPGTDNLMYDAKTNPGILENRSIKLTDNQIGTARIFVYTNRCPDLSCIEEAKVN
jgi:hypothetical protein